MKRLRSPASIYRSALPNRTFPLLISPNLTCFAFTGGVQVVVGAQQLALSVRPAVIDARRQVRAHVYFSGDIRAHFEPGGAQTGEDGGEDPSCVNPPFTSPNKSDSWRTR